MREYIQSSILATYQANGFQRIMTPAIEDIENLNKSDGGDNLNLIFKILKRGEKLSSALATGEGTDQLADLGLRYDLTVPLSRYYANNRSKLMLPFKCIQIDKVYRAERPQKGRTRELVQCDIDIIGSDSINCEIELIHVTAKALLQLGIRNFKIKINDRRILRGLLSSIGFAESEVSGVCVTFDKLDKIGTAGIQAELIEKNYAIAKIDGLMSMLNNLPVTLEDIIHYLPNTDAAAHLKRIIDTTSVLSQGEYTVEFDLSLVRGQGYYTGTVFEIRSGDFNSSIAGGGRYDHMIGKFANERIPAVGFSIGFERIYCMMNERNFPIPTGKKKLAVVFDQDIVKAERIADGFRPQYDVSIFERPKKLGRLISSLKESGYDGLYILGKSAQIEAL